MTRLTTFLLSFLFSVNALASGLQASFTGSNLDGLTRTTTRAEYKSIMTAGGSLYDSSGRNHDLAATGGTPSTVTSGFQGSDGRLLKARYFDGSGVRYSVAHHADFNMFDANHTVTLVVLASSAGAGTDGLMGHFDANGGMEVELSATNYIMYYGKAGGLYTVVNNAGTYRDDKYHVVQIVRESDYAIVYVDGIPGARTSVAGYGLSATATLDIGASAGGFTPWLGSVLYARMDAEALSTDRLAFERNKILGIGTRTGTYDFGSATYATATGFDGYYRASTAYSTYSDGSMSLRAAGQPRVAGSGGGVLIEGAVTNVFTSTYQRNFSSYTNNRLAITADTYIGPDGTQTYDQLLETAFNDIHISYRTWTLTNAVTYTISVVVKPINGRYPALFTDQNGAANHFIVFNSTSGAITKQDADFVASSGRCTFLANGWLRISANIVGDGGAANFGVGVSSDGTTVSYLGDAAKGLAVGDMVLETGSFPSSIPDAATGTRTADSLTIIPYKLSKDITVPGTTPKAVFSFETQDPLAATITDDAAAYTFTRTNTVSSLNDYTKMRRFTYTAANTARHVLADAGSTWTPAGSFSVVAVVTPTSLPAAGQFMYVFGKWRSTTDERSWALYYNETGDWSFGTSQDGTSTNWKIFQKSTSAQVGRTALLVGTFTYAGSPSTPGNPTSSGVLYVDDLTPVTGAAYGPIDTNTAEIAIGRASSGTTTYLDGQIHYLAFYDGVALSQDQVTAMYSKFKQANILPIGLGTGYVGSKLTIEFEAKCPFSSSTNMGADRTLLSIGASYLTGTAPAGATTTRNYIKIFAESSDGKVYSDFYSGSSTTRRYMYSAAITTYDRWHKYKVYYDFSDLDSSQIYVDGVAGTLDASMTDASHYFNTADTLIRVGQEAAGTTDGYCQTRNLRIVPDRF